MAPDFVLRALLQHNFLPAQKRDKEEMPPCFSSASFSPDVARRLIAGKTRKSIDYQGFDAVDYKLTRFNGVSRSASIPHPTAYASASLCIRDHWQNLAYITLNENSSVRPREHADGRLIIMDYDRSVEKSLRNISGAFGKRFMVHTDIASCYASVYSHAIPWAAVGFDHAKKHKASKYKDEWFNQLDEKIRCLKRGETQGVGVGPATSNIVCEAILARVDEKLRSTFEYVRYIDDYTAYCDTEECAQDFIRQLSEELADYKLQLNISKTVISALPQGFSVDWVTDLALRLPRADEINVHEAMNYLNLAVEMSAESPEGSVLKYAIKTLSSKNLEYKAKVYVLRYALNLSFHQPALLPLLGKLFDGTVNMLVGSEYADQLQRLAYENARFMRSDGMAWTLHYLRKYGINVNPDVAEKVLASEDCIALMLLYLSGEAESQVRVVNFAKDIDRTNLYELDQYWLLFYHLYCGGMIENPYPAEDAFNVLRDRGVSFVT